MSNMNINKMSELANRGLYSPINYYLGIIALLKEGFDVDFIMRQVPGSLRGEVREFATRHGNSQCEKTDPRGIALARQILAWDKPSASPKARYGASTMAAATGNVKSATALTLKVKRGAEHRPNRVQRAAILLEASQRPDKVASVVLLLSEGEKDVGAPARS